MNLNDIISQIVAFCEEREWSQFHSPEQLSAAIAIEAAELQEQFLWKTREQCRQHALCEVGRAAVADEVADILIYTLLLAHEIGLDPTQAVQKKLTANAARYPTDVSRGSSAKAPASGAPRDGIS